jgi:D-alanyl-D-alanine carboxypeptidase
LIHRIAITVLVVIGLHATQAMAFEQVPWAGSLADVVTKAGRPGYVVAPTRLVPATAPAAKRNGAALGEFKHAVAVPAPAKKHAKANLVGIPETRSSIPPVAGAKAATPRNLAEPKVQAKAMCCLDCGSDKMILAKNVSEPLPIASITKLLTAMIAIDHMKLDQVVEVPADIVEVPPHKVGLRPGDRFTVKDLLYGLLMESGNDCAETIAVAYPRGGRKGFVDAMNRRLRALGASSSAAMYSPSGLDTKITLGRRGARTLEATKTNVASVKDVAHIARAAFRYPLISEISGTKTHKITTRNETPRPYNLVSNIKLLDTKLPVAGAKTGFTNQAGRCIVALFKDRNKETMVVVLNSPRHFKAAEKIYQWSCKGL